MCVYVLVVCVCVYSQYSDSSQVERLMRWIRPSLCMLMLQTPVIIMIHKIESLACSIERSVFCVHVTVCVCAYVYITVCLCAFACRIFGLYVDWWFAG